MLKKIKAYFVKRKQLKAQKEQMIKMERYYRTLQCGVALINFIYNDLEKMKKNQCNRHQRRRFEKTIAQQGKFSKEMIDYYSKHIDKILQQIEEQKNKGKKK